VPESTNGIPADVEQIVGGLQTRAHGTPAISVVIPVYNHWAVTSRCLASLAACDPHVPLQIVVVDDGSSDETVEVLPRIPGVDMVRNGTNLGFIGACNRGASIARAPYLHFLNNDTTLEPGALAALLARIESDPSIGIVGSKLVYPDGTLQEAGGIIFDDANGWNYGRGAWPEQPEFEFVRDVDYVSGASLLVRTDLFSAAGGFDTRYAPAYYEDADLCFTVRSLGARVVYEPRSTVVHYEGVSSGTDLTSGVKRHQTINRATFEAKWRTVLQRDHLAPSPASVLAGRDRGPRERTILVIDSYVPMHDKEAGSNRLFQLVRGFVAAGQRVIFLADNLLGEQPYCGELQALGVEVLYHTPRDTRTWQEHLLRVLPLVDVAWICRPELCSKYLLFVRRNSAAAILYDMIDLHFLRLRREAEIRESSDETAWRAQERLEVAAAGAADGTVVVTELERRIMQEYDIENVAVVPTVHDMVVRAPREMRETSGVLFIGGYNHTPNVDGAHWLVEAIMPLVWQQAPHIHVTLLGANPPPAVRGLAGDRVTVTGYLPDVEPYFLAARVFVAPLRFGAGIKGKIGHSLSYALPTITTPVGAEGFRLVDGRNARIAATEYDFACAILDLYSDEAAWRQISAGCAEVLEPFSSRSVCSTALTFIRSVSAPGAANGVSTNGVAHGPAPLATFR
jgi:GT2 family glycosyltransferase